MSRQAGRPADGLGKMFARGGRRGNLSILSAVIAGALCASLIVWLNGARLRADERSVTAAMQSLADTTLSGYDSDLLRDYGLFAVTDSAVDRGVFARQTRDIRDVRLIGAVTESDALDTSYLGNQIDRYMKTRLPFVYWQELSRRLNIGTPQAGRIKSLLDGLGAVRKSGGTPDSPKSPPGGTDVVSESPIRSVLRELTGSIAKELGDDAIDTLNEAYLECAAETFGVSGSMGLGDGSFEDLCSPERIASVGGFLDRLLDWKTPPVLNRLQLVEYGVGCFTRQCIRTVEAGGPRPVLFLSGRPMSEAINERPAEAEQLIFGLGDRAAAKMRISLRVLRTVQQAIALFSDHSRMARIESTATVICAALLAASAGSVAIDPKLVTYLLAIGESIYKGCRDVQTLLQGHRVGLWPGNSDFEIGYADYLRLLVLLVPEELLLQRIGALIGKRAGHPLHTAVNLSVEWRGRPLVLKKGYG